MMDATILDEIFPVPEIADLKEIKVRELRQRGFTITNFRTGGIFNTLLMITLEVKIELIKLLRGILSQMFIRSASGIWLELRAEDYSKKLKRATKTQGKVNISREPGNAGDIIIPVGSVFKTNRDINGEELRYFSLNAVVMPKESNQADVLVEAEKAGSNYNVPMHQITKALIHIEGVGGITNQGEWITKEGSDKEDMESLRERVTNSWAELSSRPIALKYKNVCEAVDGVLYVRVDDMHPRGQGTVDIIVTSTAGAATESLLEEVRDAAEGIRGETDNILVKSAVTVTMDIHVNITILKMSSENGIREKAIAILNSYFKINKNRNLNEVILIDILVTLKNAIPIIKNVKIINPSEDVIQEKDKVIILGNVEVDISREE